MQALRKIRLAAAGAAALAATAAPASAASVLNVDWGAGCGPPPASAPAYPHLAAVALLAHFVGQLLLDRGILATSTPGLPLSFL